MCRCGIGACIRGDECETGGKLTGGKLTGGRLRPDFRSRAAVGEPTGTAGNDGGGGGTGRGGRPEDDDRKLGTGIPARVGRRGAWGRLTGGGVGANSSTGGGLMGAGRGFGVTSAPGGRACSRISGGGSLATVRSSSSKKRSAAMLSAVFSSVISLSKICVSSSSSSQPIFCDGGFAVARGDDPPSLAAAPRPGPGPPRDGAGSAPPTAERRDASAGAATGAAIWRYCSSLSLSSSISTAKVFFIQAARSLRE